MPEFKRELGRTKTTLHLVTSLCTGDYDLAYLCVKLPALKNSMHVCGYSLESFIVFFGNNSKFSLYYLMMDFVTTDDIIILLSFATLGFLIK